MRTDLILEFAREFGSGRVRAPHDFESAVAEVVLEPASPDELGEMVRKCERDRITVAPIGASRTLRYLRPAPVVAGISLVAIAKVISYEPDDMTVVAGAGLTLGALNAALGSHRQHLPVDPQHPERTAIGALLGAAQGGPLRLSAGSVRDFLIGVQFVGHQGRLVRGGGRVVKNVAGYDLMKLMIGSFGTLGIITEATFKVRPVPQVYAAAVGYPADLAGAFAAGFKLLDVLPILHLELLSPGMRIPSAREGQYLLIAGAGGNRKDVDYQLGEIRKIIPDANVFEGEEAAALYRAIRDVRLPDAPLTMQISVAPRDLPACLSASDVHFRAHVGSGVAQLAFDSGPDEDGSGAVALAAVLRRAAAQAGGHSRLLSIDAALRDSVAFFDTPAAGAMSLMRRVKETFDPAGIFNPECFVGGL